MIIRPVGGSGGSGTGNDTRLQQIVQKFNTTLGQTIFNLSDIPNNTNNVKFTFGGFTFYSPDYFIVAGSTLTWLNNFVFESGDKVEIEFFKTITI
jgi:hypothetical protein